MNIRVLDRAATLAAAESLGELLSDAVAGGASVGFDSALPVAEATGWWRDVVAERVRAGAAVLLVAELDGEIAGTVQLAFPSFPNGRHRAEVAKLLVHSRRRRMGVGRALMLAVEEQARQAGRSLLILDTAGDEARRLYLELGWQIAGDIPDFAIGAGGRLLATTFMYRRLT